jgi:hypothetical protein
MHSKPGYDQQNKMTFPVFGSQMAAPDSAILIGEPLILGGV